MLKEVKSNDFVRRQDYDKSATFYFTMISVNCVTWPPMKVIV